MGTFNASKPEKKVKCHEKYEVHRLKLFKFIELGEGIDPSGNRLTSWSVHVEEGSMVSHLCQWLRGFIHYKEERKSKILAWMCSNGG